MKIYLVHVLERIIDPHSKLSILLRVSRCGSACCMCGPPGMLQVDDVRAYLQHTDGDVYTVYMYVACVRNWYAML